MTASVATAFFECLGRSAIEELYQFIFNTCLFDHASAANIDGLATFLAKLKHLQYLELTEGNDFTAEQTTKLIAALGRSTSIKHLDLLSLRGANFD